MFLYQIFLFFLTFSPPSASVPSFDEKITFPKGEKQPLFDTLSDGTLTDGEGDMESEKVGIEQEGCRYRARKRLAFKDLHLDALILERSPWDNVKHIGLTLRSLLV